MTKPKKKNRGIALLIFIIVIALALYGAVKLVTNEGTQCLAGPMKFGAKIIEEKHDSPVSCTCSTQSNAVYRFNTEGDIEDPLASFEVEDKKAKG